MNILLALLCCNTCDLISNNELSYNPSPKVIIIGAGAAGIAAASRLLENGFTDVTILEAENRIGGRVHSIEVGGYMIDMGGQWIHGEKGNVAFELAWPLGLIERQAESFDVETNYFISSGSMLAPNKARLLQEIHDSIDQYPIDIENLKSGSYGEFVERKLIEIFKNHPEVPKHLHSAILRSFNFADLTTTGADSWHHISAKGVQDYPDCVGDQSISWKNRTYSTILDILMKRYPDPKDELPVLEKTHKNSKVIKIDYSEDSESMKVSTADGIEYSADHVIFTPSLGVLKANHQLLFNPPLPERKVKAIENLGYGHTAKIWLYYKHPWWDSTGYKVIINPILWTKEVITELESEPKIKWVLGIYGIMSVEHKPNFLCLWVVTNSSIEIESIPEKYFNRQVIGALSKLYELRFRIPKPTKIIRTLWNTNENFLGTYSHHTLQTDRANVSNADLAEPVMHNGRPVLQFAGEATSPHYATVNGAIASGWREADRLIDLYKKKSDTSQFLKQLAGTSIIA